jgi:hypothetical protein
VKKIRSKGQQILKFMEANPSMKASEVAKQFKTNVQYVYSLRYMKKKKGLLVSTSSKPKQTKQTNIKIAAPEEIVEFRMRETIQRLLTIIDYLEGRLRREHGTPV